MENQTSSVAWLESAGGQQTPLRGTCFLGRSAGNTLVLPEEKVSRRHAMIHAQEQHEFWLIDLGSSNGTYLNGRRVCQPCRLNDQDQIAIASFAFTFQQPKVQPRAQNDPAGAEKTIQEIKTQTCWLLVADIESSTQFIQKAAADEAPRITGIWLAACKQIIDDNGGAINKFLGDGFFAYWTERENTAALVARALAALRQLQDKEHPRFRVVLHHGNVFSGGAASLGEESLMGNEVNFVFRMEKLAGSLGASRMMSESASARLQPIMQTTAEGRHPLPSFEGDFPFFSF